jgi:hypothetical protein
MGDPTDLRKSQRVPACGTNDTSGLPSRCSRMWRRTSSSDIPRVLRQGSEGVAECHTLDTLSPLHWQQRKMSSRRWDKRRSMGAALRTPSSGLRQGWPPDARKLCRLIHGSRVAVPRRSLGRGSRIRTRTNGFGDRCASHQHHAPELGGSSQRNASCLSRHPRFLPLFQSRPARTPLALTTRYEECNGAALMPCKAKSLFALRLKRLSHCA